MYKILAIIFLSQVIAHAQQDAPPAIGSALDLAGFSEVFRDNFDSVSVRAPEHKLDKTWLGNPPYGPAGNFSFSHWSSDSRSLRAENGSLVMTCWWDESIANQAPRQWRSPCIASVDRASKGFAQRFGYWEAKIKFPNVAGRGAFCAFWLHSMAAVPNAGPKGYEIDIAEYWSRVPGQVAFTVHPWNPSGGGQAGPPYSSGGFHPIADTSGTWHTYGVMVSPKWISCYYDGKCVRNVPTHLDYLEDPLYILLDYALEGPPTGEPYDSHGDSSMLVDYVAAYGPPLSWIIPPAPGASIRSTSVIPENN
jgi:Glycosyl hydrolases family 16